MALYPKKLRSLDDLQREKKLLKKEIERLDKDESLSLNGLMGNKSGKKKKKDREGDEGGAFSVIDMLPISSPVTVGLLKLVADRFINRRGSRNERSATYQELKPKKHIVRNAAIELLGGYLKWKAVELSYKGVQHLIRKRKEKKAYEASLEFPSRIN